MVARRAVVYIPAGSDDDLAMRRSLVALAIASAIGCGKPLAEVPTAPRGSAKEAKQEARALIEEAYRVLRDGDPVSLMGLLAPDLFFVGPGPDEVGLDRSAAIELAGTFVDSRKKHKLRSLGLEIAGGPDGHSAWAIDQLEYDGHDLAVAVVAAQVDGLWTITAIEVAEALPARKRDRRAAPLPPLPRWKPPEAKVSAHAAPPREVAGLLTAAAGDEIVRLDQYGKQRDAAFVGGGPDEVEVGAKAIAKAWRKRSPTWQLDDTLAGATPDGGLAWVVAHGALIGAPDRDDRDDRRRKRRDRDDDDRARDDEAAPAAGSPRRLFALYRNDGAGWDLALIHESAPVAR